MLMSLLLAATLTSAHPNLHRDTVPHGPVTVEVSYHAKVTTRLRQVGMSAGTRMGSERCLWTSHVAVEREVARPNAVAGLSRMLPDAASFSGSRHGSCATARRAIGQEVAGRGDTVRAHVEQAAARDRSRLHAELGAARSLALN